MRKIIHTLKASSLLAILCFSTSFLWAQGPQKKIQVAILFDTSNSMDGLIDQAKSRIWSIVNTLTTLRYGNNEVPTIEFALYDYGNDNIPVSANYVRLISPLTSDLDLLSQKLFGLTTRGGQEYCGAVIQTAINELEWTRSNEDLKIMYIAGNEPFNQGKINYKEVCKLAVERDIQVNTIYCGDYQQGISEFWYDGAQLGKGEYSNINSNLQVRQYVTPYDGEINSYNDSLNRTYVGYGSLGETMKANQIAQDGNAELQSISVKSERASAKAKSVYRNDSWDIVDGIDSQKIDLKTAKDADLPDEMKGKSLEEKEKMVLDLKMSRANFQDKINDLSKKRNEFIEEEKKKEAGGQTADLGSEISKQLVKSAELKGLKQVIE